jgi:hypothetical protein
MAIFLRIGRSAVPSVATAQLSSTFWHTSASPKLDWGLQHARNGLQHRPADIPLPHIHDMCILSTHTVAAALLPEHSIAQRLARRPQ